MRLINRLTSNPLQTMVLTGNQGQRTTLNMRYIPSQQSWIMDVVQGDFKLYGVSVVASPNLLLRYSNIIQFGLSCTTVNGVDPFRVDDFESGYSKLYLLNDSDVEEIKVNYFE